MGERVSSLKHENDCKVFVILGLFVYQHKTAPNHHKATTGGGTTPPPFNFTQIPPQ